MTSKAQSRSRIRPFEPRDTFWIWEISKHFGQWNIPRGTAWILRQDGPKWVIPGKSFGAAFKDECDSIAVIVLTAPDGIRDTIALVDVALEKLKGVRIHSHHADDGGWAARLLKRRWGFEMKDGVLQKEC